MRKGKSGIWRRWVEEKKRYERDRLIYDFLRRHEFTARTINRATGIPDEPLLVFSNYPFPIFSGPCGKRLPEWEDLSQRFKLQLMVWLLSEMELSFLTFNANMHPAFERKWVHDGRDIRKAVRDRFRRELDRSVRPNMEWFFVLEGYAGRLMGPTFLHIHGGALILTTSDIPLIEKAAGRAVGQGTAGYSREARSTKVEVFHGGDTKWPNYLLKHLWRPDARLTDERLAFSRPMVQATKMFWDWITGRGWVAKSGKLLTKQDLWPERFKGP